MNRRDFLEAFAGMAGLVMMGNLPEKAQAEITRKVVPTALNFRHIEIPIGLETPFKALHISDTHLVRAYKSDDDERKRLAPLRYSTVPYAEHYLNACIEYAKKNNMQLIHTGDIYDYITEANLDLTAMYLGQNDIISAIGNHEFNIHLQEAKQDAAYKARCIDEVQSVFPQNITFSSTIKNGVNFVSIDDSFFNITEEQHALMEKEVKKGLPIILLCHIPLYTPKHAERNMKTNHRRHCGVCGAPREITDSLVGRKGTSYSENEKDADWRKFSEIQKADPSTLEFCSWLKEQTLLKGILCGHCHHYYIERFSPTAIQYCVDANFRGGGYTIDLL